MPLRDRASRLCPRPLMPAIRLAWQPHVHHMVPPICRSLVQVSCRSRPWNDANVEIQGETRIHVRSSMQFSPPARWYEGQRCLVVDFAPCLARHRSILGASTWRCLFVGRFLFDTIDPDSWLVASRRVVCATCPSTRGSASALVPQRLDRLDPRRYVLMRPDPKGYVGARQGRRWRLLAAEGWYWKGGSSCQPSFASSPRKTIHIRFSPTGIVEPRSRRCRWDRGRRTHRQWAPRNRGWWDPPPLCESTLANHRGSLPLEPQNTQSERLRSTIYWISAMRSVPQTSRALRARKIASSPRTPQSGRNYVGQRRSPAVWRVATSAWPAVWLRRPAPLSQYRASNGRADNMQP